jgi:predicted N-formylglutamate amidohydrolase
MPETAPPPAADLPAALLEVDEPAAVQLLRPNAASQFLLTADHAGRAIPRRLGTLGLSAGHLKRHIAWDIGIAAVTEQLSHLLDATAVLQRYSRLVIDCNRPPHAADSIPLRSEDTEIPGNAGLPAAQRVQRRQEIFEPYHAQIRSLLDARLAAGRPTILLAMHSFTPIYRGQTRPMQIGILYHRGRALASLLLELLRQEPGLTVGDNAPYSVSDETDYGIPEHGEKRGLVHAEIEIRQDLIGDAAGAAAWAGRLALLFRRAAALLPGPEASAYSERTDIDGPMGRF